MLIPSSFLFLFHPSALLSSLRSLLFLPLAHLISLLTIVAASRGRKWASCNNGMCICMRFSLLPLLTSTLSPPLPFPLSLSPFPFPLSLSPFPFPFPLSPLRSPLSALRSPLSPLPSPLSPLPSPLSPLPSPL